MSSDVEKGVFGIGFAKLTEEQREYLSIEMLAIGTSRLIHAGNSPAVNFTMKLSNGQEIDLLFLPDDPDDFSRSIGLALGDYCLMQMVDAATDKVMRGGENGPS